VTIHFQPSLGLFMGSAKLLLVLLIPTLSSQQPPMAAQESGIRAQTTRLVTLWTMTGLSTGAVELHSFVVYTDLICEVWVPPIGSQPTLVRVPPHQLRLLILAPFKRAAPRNLIPAPPTRQMTVSLSPVMTALRLSTGARGSRRASGVVSTRTLL